MSNPLSRFMTMTCITLIGLTCMALLLFGLNQAERVQASTAGVSTCFISLNNTNVTDYESGDGAAVQLAIEAVNDGGLLKVAGNCSGVSFRNSISQTAYITKSVIIRGGYTQTDWSQPSDPETYTTTLDAAGNGRVAVIIGDINVTLENLHLTGGNSEVLPSISPTFDTGGGIWSNGTLTISNSHITANTAAGDGGGLYLGRGSLFLENSLVEANQSAEGGGGINSDNGSQLTIESSTLRMNAANGDFLDGYGGALLNQAATAVINNSFIYSNTAQVGGGLINYGPLTITHSTIQANYARGYGGGVQNHNPLWLINTTVNENKSPTVGGVFHSQGSLTLAHTTIVSNTAATSGSGGLYYDFDTFLDVSGGISDTPPDITNSIIAHNEGPDGNNCLGMFNDLGYNLEDANECSLNAASSLTNTNPLLTAQANYGGETPVYGLQSGSPAIDHIPDGASGCGTTYVTDQRGQTRPYDGNFNTTPACDIGAFEFALNRLIYLPIVFK